MTPADMENALTKLDRRLETVEQILPTLTTKADLERFATKADLERFATKADLERFATKADLERFATKTDLEQFATKNELREAIADAKQHADIGVEDVRDDIRKVAEAIAGLSTAVAGNQTTLEQVVQRLDVHEAMLADLTKPRS